MINSPRCCKKKKRNPFLFAVQGFALNRDDSGATVPQPPEQSAFPWESKCEMIAGFCDCRQTCYWSLPLRFCWPSRERKEKTLQDFPYAHTHTHTHTYTQSPFTTVLQFPELLNNVIISLPLSCPLTAPWLSFPTPHSRASFAPLCRTKPPSSEVTPKSPAPTRASLITPVLKQTVH